MSLRACLLLLPASLLAQDDALRSRAERTGYEETSKYEEVLAFTDALARRSDRVRVGTFGRTEEGRALPLIVLADPPVATPREAAASGKPVVFVFANIHGGEVEGKEAMHEVARRLALGDLGPLLDRVVVLIAPIYNADGNERIDLANRAAQNGPVGGVGRRENAKGLDLNRDYVKLEAAETRALVRLLNRWDPHITVDLHTTNGSHHGYHLTYSIPLNPNVDARVLDYHRDRMMPALGKAMLEGHRFRTYYYGNFYGPPENRSWRAFDHRPRIGQNYVGFRNRLTILSEAYSYLDFRRRIQVTAAFVEEILRFAAANGGEIRELARGADRDALSLPGRAMGVAFEIRPLAEPVEILAGEVVRVRNPRSGREMTAMIEDKATPVRMQDFGTFTATRSVAAPRAWLFRREAATEPVVGNLLAHGVTVEELTAPFTAEVESFTVAEAARSPRAFQGHNEVRLSGVYRKETVEFPAGSIVVRAAQPLGALTFYLLEAESDDGLATWNFLDSSLAAGGTYPIYRLIQGASFSARVVSGKAE
jgi:hypothetical protein